MALATSEERAQGRSWALPRALRSPHILLVPALAAILAVQWPTLHYFYYFDDYVPFGEMAGENASRYIWRLLTSTDVTPNWRPLPGLLYFASWRVAGMNPFPVHVVMLALHAGTAALIYYAVWRTTRRSWAGLFAALIFGLNPAYVGALSQVTTATQQLGAFFLVATLVAVIECCESRERVRANAWLGAALVLWVLAIASHEGMAGMFPVFGLALLSFDAEPDGRWQRAALRTAPFAAIGCATALSFAACQCNEGSTVWGTDYAWRQTVIYLGRLLYPVGLEPPWNVGVAHMAAAAGLALCMALTAITGPKITRVGAAWVLLSVAPHVFITYFTASRYLYIPAVGLGLMAGGIAALVGGPALRLAPRAAAAVGIVGSVAIGAWYIDQTRRQEEPFKAATERWRGFHTDVTSVFPTVPAGTRVIVIGGPFPQYEFQLHILPAFAEATWGDGVSITDVEPDSLPAMLARLSDSKYVAEYQSNGQLVPIHGDPSR